MRSIYEQNYFIIKILQKTSPHDKHKYACLRSLSLLDFNHIIISKLIRFDYLFLYKIKKKFKFSRLSENTEIDFIR